MMKLLVEGPTVLLSCVLVSGCFETDVTQLPLVSIDALQYQGGFRLSPASFGDTPYATLNYSPMPQMAYNPANHSLFIVGHDYEQSIAEFKIPAIVNSTQLEDLNIGDEVVQNFAMFHGTDRVDTGINDYFRVTGMELIDNALMVNYIDWYDAGGTVEVTSVVFDDASNLANTSIKGPYKLTGAAHASGWISEIPQQWQATLEGTHISGAPAASIISRLSVGPSAFVFNPRDDVIYSKPEGYVPSNGLLDFSLEHILYDKSIFGDDINAYNTDPVLYNESGLNDLWTIVTGAHYGFIIPDTRTYMTLGYSGGHNSGLGYKIVQDNGNQCGGPCAYDPDDYYNYYWLWDMNDLLEVKNGNLVSYDVRPYAYGTFDVPFDAPVHGGSYDHASKTLYLSLKQADTLYHYSNPPVIVTYLVDETIEHNTAN